jgi:hypothetical protein
VGFARVQTGISRVQTGFSRVKSRVSILRISFDFIIFSGSYSEFFFSADQTGWYSEETYLEGEGLLVPQAPVRRVALQSGACRPGSHRERRLRIDLDLRLSGCGFRPGAAPAERI